MSDQSVRKFTSVLTSSCSQSQKINMSFLSKYYKIFEEFGKWLLALILVNVKEIILHSTYL